MTAVLVWTCISAMMMPRRFLVSWVLFAARTRSFGLSLICCRSSLVRLCSRAASYLWGSFSSGSTLEMFSSVRTVRSAVRTSRTSVWRACSLGVWHWAQRLLCPG